MHTLLLTLALFMTSADPTRDALLQRFDAARARLAAADLATLESAVQALERTIGARGSPERDHERGAHDDDRSRCLEHQIERFQRAGHSLDSAADRGRAACAGADVALLDDLIEAYRNVGHSLDSAVERARVAAADPGLAFKAEPFTTVRRAYQTQGHSLDSAVTRTRDLLRPLSVGGARCVVQMYPRFSQQGHALDSALRRAAETCARN